MNIARYLSDDLSRPRCLGLQFNDLASLIAGVKSVVYTSVGGEEEMRRLDDLCGGLKLKKLILAEKKNVSDEPIIDILIGPRPAELRRAGRAYSNVMSHDWGTALGYPECCVKSYLGWKRRKDLIFHILDASPAGVLFPFWMNNITNYYSRLGLLASDRRNFTLFSGLNEGTDKETVIPWHPCSYHCPETMKKGRRIYEVLERYMPATAGARKSFLSRPVVFSGKFSYVSLDGDCTGETGGFRVVHRGPADPRSPQAGRILKAFASPGEFRVSPRGKIEGHPGGRLPPGTVLIPFSPLKRG
ncbi:MAG: hypothetical protein RQ748_02595 [Elusimicrobiales bacterium]|nr:hypothetical protein [Elusimicrobiales bacterium]